VGGERKKSHLGEQALNPFACGGRDTNGSDCSEEEEVKRKETKGHSLVELIHNQSKRSIERSHVLPISCTNILLTA
jgi:hypothetical protein